MILISDDFTISASKRPEDNELKCSILSQTFLLEVICLYCNISDNTLLHMIKNRPKPDINTIKSLLRKLNIEDE